jgi:hypothetical protein
MTHERLDETIDRVARDLTAAPADPALVTRITARVEGARSQRFEWWRIALPAMGVAAVALFAFVMLPRDLPRDTTSPAPPPVATAPVLPPSHAATPVAPVVEPVPQRASGRRPRREPLPAFEPQIPQIEALSSPALLAVDGLTENHLTIAPVDVASLDLANLAFTDADRRDDPKE